MNIRFMQHTEHWPVKASGGFKNVKDMNGGKNIYKRKNLNWSELT